MSGSEDEIEILTTPPNPVKLRYYPDSFKAEDYIMELTVLSFLVVYLVNFIYGRSRNATKAKRWLSNTKSIWTEKFALVGHSDKQLIFDSPSDFIFYASGRNFIKSVIANIETIPRQDLYSLLSNFVSSTVSGDFVTFNFSFDSDLVDDFIFAILPKKTASRVIQSRYDLSEMTKSRDIANFPKDLKVYSDSMEFINLLMNDSSVLDAFWNSFGLDNKGAGISKLSVIESIIFSCQSQIKPEKYFKLT